MNNSLKDEMYEIEVNGNAIDIYDPVVRVVIITEFNFYEIEAADLRSLVCRSVPRRP